MRALFIVLALAIWAAASELALTACHDEALATLRSHFPEKSPSQATNYNSWHVPNAPQQLINYLQRTTGVDLKKYLGNRSDRKEPKKVNRQVLKGVVAQLRACGTPQADRYLAELNFFGNFTHPVNYPEALRLYEKLAEQEGDANAQFMAGLIHSTGVFGAVPVDQAKASLFYTFSALGGDPRASMALGFRYLAGIGLPIDYKQAYHSYHPVAAASLKWYQEGSPTYPVGGVHLKRHAYSIADELGGGVFGQGASDSSSGQAPLHSRMSGGFKNFEEAIDYFHYMAEEGESISAYYALALLYYDIQDYARSVRYARSCADLFWFEDGWLKTDEDVLKIGATCSGMVGNRYFRGEGVEQDFAEAFKWYSRGVALQDRVCSYGLGVLYLHGWGTEKNYARAYDLIKDAADRFHGPAQYLVGQLLSDKASAHEYMVLASRNKQYGAWLYMAEHFYQEGRYDDAVTYLKQLCEEIELFSPFVWANAQYKSGNIDSALLGYLIGAEQGYAAGQMNVAFILDDHSGYISLLPYEGTNDTLYSALVYYTRAARQGNADARIKMGDIYYYGRGVNVSYEQAAQCYTNIADRMQGMGLALFNMGYMYEHGIGVSKDVHLAKRYYDLAVESTPDASLAAKLALLRLSFFGSDSKSNMFSLESWRRLFRQWWDMEVPVDPDDAIYSFEHDEDDPLEFEDLEFDPIAVLIVGAWFVGFMFWRRWRARRAINQQQRRHEEERQRQQQEAEQRQRREAELHVPEEQPRDEQLRQNEVPGQNDARDEQNVEQNEQNEEDPLINRPFGADIGHPDEHIVPNLYN
ncbi:hypothetical protein TRVA0_045S00232 [Trichomonascus vanleenenianus]|uniref:ubiquitin ligase complex subunit HRD3 n=1 Tax=Trichomonascus vanleenenianus TaxID=2268995 RepID=UPI003EC97899